MGASGKLGNGQILKDTRCTVEEFGGLTPKARFPPTVVPDQQHQHFEVTY